MIAYNIDKGLATRATSYPFTTGCKLQLAGSDFPELGITSIKVYVPQGAALPVRMSSVIADDSDTATIRVNFTDATGNVVAILTCEDYNGTEAGNYSANRFLTDANGALAGFVTYSYALPRFLATIASGNGGSIATSMDDFILATEHVVPMVYGTCRTIAVNDDVHTSNVCIQPAKYCKAVYDKAVKNSGVDSKSYKLSVTGPFTEVRTPNGLCWLRVNCISRYNGAKTQPNEDTYKEAWLGGRHLVIKSGIASNIRVIKENDSGIVRLEGVKDA